MIKAEAGRECGVRVTASGTMPDMVTDMLAIVQALYGDISRLSHGRQRAEFFRCALVAGLAPDSPVWQPCQGDVTSVVASGDAAEALARAFEKGGQQRDDD